MLRGFYHDRGKKDGLHVTIEVWLLETHELEVLATVQVETGDTFYKIVDFLNRTLKPYNLAFGLSKEEDGSLWLSVYELTEQSKSH
jgi:hypothetical protein